MPMLTVEPYARALLREQSGTPPIDLPAYCTLKAGAGVMKIRKNQARKFSRKLFRSFRKKSNPERRYIACSPYNTERHYLARCPTNSECSYIARRPSKIQNLKKDIIKRGGESINAPEIEKLINGCPGVDMVGVVGMPDPDMGERICAYIQPRPGADLSFDRIIGYLKDKKASVLQFPERIEFVDKMPLTAAGKLNKRALKEDIIAKLA